MKEVLKETLGLIFEILRLLAIVAGIVLFIAR